MNTSATLRTYELPCYDSRKSFYGKARCVWQVNKGTTLHSYSTDICTVTDDGCLIKHDPVATATTRRHIRSFLQHMNLPVLDNRAWDKLPLHQAVSLNDLRKEH